MFKTALVTGASSGIGEAIARRLLADNYRVYAGARRTERMASLGEAGAKLLALDPQSKRGIASACTAGGMGVTAILERA